MYIQETYREMHIQEILRDINYQLSNHDLFSNEKLIMIQGMVKTLKTSVNYVSMNGAMFGIDGAKKNIVLKQTNDVIQNVINQLRILNNCYSSNEYDNNFTAIIESIGYISDIEKTIQEIKSGRNLTSQ